MRTSYTLILWAAMTIPFLGCGGSTVVQSTTGTVQDTGGQGGEGGAGGDTGGSQGGGGQAVTLKLNVIPAGSITGGAVCMDADFVMGGGFQLVADEANSKAMKVKRVSFTHQDIGSLSDIAYVRVQGDALPLAASPQVKFDSNTFKASFDLNFDMPSGAFTTVYPVLTFDAQMSGGQHYVSILEGDLEVEEGEVTGLPLNGPTFTVANQECSP